jgi:hypothetical protein
MHTAVAAGQCVPESAVVCRIYFDGGSLYRLEITFQSINEISIWDSGRPSSKLKKAALVKLETQAQQLLSAGVCKIIMNDIEQ